MITLTDRARFYAKVVAVLYGERKIRGELKTATRGARHLSLGVRLANPLDLDTARDLAEPLALAVNCPAVIAQRLPNMPGLVSYQFQLCRGLWETYTRADLQNGNVVGVGLGEGRQQVNFAFEPPHALIAGTTGCGKSETVRSLLAGLLNAHRPEDMRVIICDPHHDYEDFRNVAHRIMPIANTDEDILNALTFIGQELTQRRVHDQRDATPWIVVVDEAQDCLHDRSLALAQKIAGEARKFGIHMIVSTQKPTQRNLPDLVDRLNYRLIGMVDNANTSAILTGHAGLQAHKLTGQGDFLQGIGPQVKRLQVALATQDDLKRLPKAAVGMPEVREEDTPQILNIPPDEKGPGRPSTEIDPCKVAYYLLRGVGRVTRTEAESRLGLKRYAHVAHRDFAQAIIDEIKRLLRGKK